jgi:putative NADPH-quinone reductase
MIGEHMSKALVAYFSASGTTAVVARTLAQAVGADVAEIVPEQPYSTADLNWRDSKSRSSVEMNDESSRPAIVDDGLNVSAYDVVYVGFPVWWYVEPRIIDTFLEAHDFAGKKIVPFATSGGSGLGKAPQRMQAIAAGATVVSGGLLNGNPGIEELRDWANAQ